MNSKQLTVAPPQVPEVTREKVVEYLDAFGLSTELSDNEKRQFIEIACEFKLNPFKREIFCIPYGQGDSRKLSIITGYEVYVKRAERSGKLNGWRAWTEGSGDELKAIVEIHRKDWDKPFLHEVYWKESAQKKKDGTLTSFWVKQPRFQLKKVAISQGFRLCFPDELAGIPYVADELPEEMGPAEGMRIVSPPQPSQKESAQPQTSHTASRGSPSSAVGAQNGGKPKAEPAAMRTPEPSSDRTALIEQINRILSVNTHIFPSAHVQWVQAQLRGNPSLARLKEIMAHLAGVLSKESDTSDQPPASPPSSEESHDEELF